MPTVDELLGGAAQQAGLDDFGPDGFQEGLRTLVTALPDARLNDVGRAALPDQLTKALVNRLRVVDWAKRHPELTERGVEAPVFILGLPRTGTTLLSYLLDQDPAARSLLRWEALDSVPPPRADALRTDPRVEQARLGQELLDELNPRFRSIHDEAPAGPTECVAVLAQDFKSLMWEVLVNVDGYGRWLSAVDQISAYRYHRLTLQVLQHHAAGRWTLKTPHHAMALDALLAVYPDARLLVTHRDPVRAIASMCSLVESLTGTFSDADHRRYIGRRWSAVSADMLDAVMALPRRHPQVPVHHIRYDDLVADPLAAVGRVYAFLGAELTPTVEAAMRRHLEANPQGKHGPHTYAAGDYELDPADLAERHRAYADAFDLPTTG